MSAACCRCRAPCLPWARVHLAARSGIAHCPARARIGGRRRGSRRPIFSAGSAAAAASSPDTPPHPPTPPLLPHPPGYGNWYDAPLPLVQGGNATYFGATVPFDLGTLAAIEFALMAGAESFRGAGEPEKRVYPGGAFDPMGMVSWAGAGPRRGRPAAGRGMKGCGGGGRRQRRRAVTATSRLHPLPRSITFATVHFAFVGGKARSRRPPLAPSRSPRATWRS